MSGTLWVRGAADVAGRPCEVLVADGALVAVGEHVAAPAGTPVLDATGLTVAPGLIDLQVNGAAGIDITTEPERLWEVGAELARHGVTAFQPTVITGDPDARERALASLRGGRPAHVAPGAVPLALHFEGPMLAASHKGAHPADRLAAPSLPLVDGWSRDAGVGMVTIAPELPGALEVVEELVRRGVVVSVGHTAATTADVEKAVTAGATCLTHLFNAMPGLHHREPGPVGVALGGDRLVAGVISDGHHVDPLAIQVAWRSLGPERFLAVSDTTAALGLGEGATVLGDQEVLIADGAVRLPDGTLAGSAASLADCLRVLLRLTGCSLREAVTVATATPAGVAGAHDRGRLEPGCRGDLVLCEADPFEVVATVVAGQVVHDARASRRR